MSTKTCDVCLEVLPETVFRRYQNKKSGEFRRLSTCNACRQKNPKRPDLVKLKTKTLPTPE